MFIEHKPSKKIFSITYVHSLFVNGRITSWLVFFFFLILLFHTFCQGSQKMFKSNFLVIWCDFMYF